MAAVGIKIPLAIVVTIVLASMGLTGGAVTYIYGQDSKRIERAEVKVQQNIERVTRLEEKFAALKEDTAEIKVQVEVLKSQTQKSTEKILEEIRRSK